jgi:hypothetical protein
LVVFSGFREQLVTYSSSRLGDKTEQGAQRQSLMSAELRQWNKTRGSPTALQNPAEGERRP